MIIFVYANAVFWKHSAQHVTITLLTKVVVVTVFTSVAQLLNRERETPIALHFFTVVLALLTYLLNQMTWQVTEAFKRVKWFWNEAVLAEAYVLTVYADEAFA